MNKNLSRRDFLKLAGVTSAGLALSACGVKATEFPTGTPLPTKTLTPIPIPTSTPTPQNDLKKNASLLKAADNLMGALRKNNISKTSEELLSGLEVITTDVTSSEGNLVKIKIATVESPDENGNTLRLPIALNLSDTQNILWEEITFRAIGNAKSQWVGSWSVGSDPRLYGYGMKDTNAYWDVAGGKFNMVKASISFSKSTMDSFDPKGEMADFATKNAYKRGAGIYAGDIVYHNIKGRPNDIPSDVNTSNVDEFIDARLAFILTHAQKGKVFYFDLTSELINMYGQWEQTPVHEKYGYRILVELYKKVYRKTKEMGFKLGKDIFLGYSDYGTEMPGIKQDLVFELLKFSKETIIQELGEEYGAEITPNDVSLIVSMQFGVDGSTDRRYSYLPAAQYMLDELESVKESIRRFQEIGPVIIGEVAVYGNKTDKVPDGFEEKKKRVIEQVASLSSDSNLVKGIVFYNTFAETVDDKGKPSNDEYHANPGIIDPADLDMYPFTLEAYKVFDRMLFG